MLNGDKDLGFVIFRRQNLNSHSERSGSNLQFYQNSSLRADFLHQ